MVIEIPVIQSTTHNTLSIMSLCVSIPKNPEINPKIKPKQKPIIPKNKLNHKNSEREALPLHIKTL